METTNYIPRRDQTDIKDRNGNMIKFGDKVRFADRAEWKREYLQRLIDLGMQQASAVAEFHKRYGNGNKINLTKDPKLEAQGALIANMSGS